MLLLVASQPRSVPAHVLGKQGDSNLATTSEGGVTDMVVDTIGVLGMFGQWDFSREVTSSLELLIVQYTYGAGIPEIEKWRTLIFIELDNIQLKLKFWGEKFSLSRFLEFSNPHILVRY